jgi:hypothetical protein
MFTTIGGREKQCGTQRQRSRAKLQREHSLAERRVELRYRCLAQSGRNADGVGPPRPGTINYVAGIPPTH